MIRKIKVTDYPRLMEIWESAVSSTHDFLKEEDFLYYKEDSVPKSVYSPSFFIFANLLIFNKIILILKNYKLGTCKYLHFAPPFP